MASGNILRRNFVCPVFILLVLSVSSGNAQQLCNPHVIGVAEVATAQQRYAAGQIAEPPLTDTIDGFAWPDTPLGVLKSDDGSYVFFGSDGGSHSRQFWHGRWYGNNKYGSVTRTIGTLDNPLGSAPPVDVTIDPNPDPAVNPYYSSYDYMGGGPVYRVPQGLPGAGNLLLVYHAEINTYTTQSFYSVLGLATSVNGGLSWTDLGEIVRINQGYRADLDGYDIGNPPLVVAGGYFYIYFRDWLANGTTHWGNTITLASVARAPVKDLLAAAFGNKPHTVPFQKYYAYAGSGINPWTIEQGLGGYSTDLNPNALYGGELQVAYNSAINRFSMIIDESTVFAYAESADGLTWTLPVQFFQTQTSTYVMPVGMGDDPRILGEQFYVFYTLTSPQGWTGNTVNRLTVTCQ